MDCEKFDRVALDLLYRELDELTSAAAKRHLEQCARCRSIMAGLRATREVGVVPMVEPPDDLEARILLAERAARRSLPLKQRLGRAVSVMAGYAMRPQLAMAALLLLLIGSSLLLIRARPGETGIISVTERGVPEAEGPGVAIVPAQPEAVARLDQQEDRAPGGGAFAPPPAAAAREEAKSRGLTDKDEAPTTFELATAAYAEGNWVAAGASFDQVEREGGPNAAQAALMSAQAARNASGCSVAGPRFEAVSTRYAGTAVASEARLQAADCFRQTGQLDRARQHYEALASVPSYGTRARKALAQLDEPAQAAPRASKARPGVGAAPPAAPVAPTAEAGASDAY